MTFATAFKPEVPAPPPLRPLEMVEESTDTRRLRILWAASHEFLTKGLEGANLDEIAITACVGKATIYKFFHDKSDLFMHCVLNAVLDAVAPLREVLDTSQPVEPVLKRFAALHIMRMTQPVVGGRPFYEMVRALVGASITNPDLARRCKHIFRMNIGAPLHAYFAMKIEQGELSGDAVFLCDHFAQTIFFTNSVILEPESAPKTDEVEALATKTVHAFLHGCRAPS